MKYRNLHMTKYICEQITMSGGISKIITHSIDEKQTTLI